MTKPNLRIFTRCILALVSCASFAVAQCGTVTIMGTVLSMNRGQITLEQYLTIPPTEVSKVEVKKGGAFVFKISVPEIGFYRLNFQSPDFPNMEAQYINLILDTAGTLTLTLKAPEIERSYVVEGSEDSRILQKLSNELKRSFLITDSLQFKFQESRRAPGINLDSLSKSFTPVYEKAVNDREDMIREFVLSNPNSIALLTAITFLDKIEDLDSYQFVDKSLYSKYPNHAYIRDFHKKIHEMSRLSQGREAPEIILFDPKGNEHKLSSYRGKVVLLTFWASSNVNSRKEFSGLHSLWEKYRKQNFQIFSVSFDHLRFAWTDVSKREKIKWVNVSDLVGQGSPIGKLYEIRNLPYYYLLDENGNILHKANQLEAFDSYFATLFSVK